MKILLTTFGRLFTKLKTSHRLKPQAKLQFYFKGKLNTIKGIIGRDQRKRNLNIKQSKKNNLKKKNLDRKLNWFKKFLKISFHDHSKAIIKNQS